MSKRQTIHWANKICLQSSLRKIFAKEKQVSIDAFLLTSPARLRLNVVSTIILRYSSANGWLPLCHYCKYSHAKRLPWYCFQLFSCHPQNKQLVNRSHSTESIVRLGNSCEKVNRHKKVLLVSLRKTKAILQAKCHSSVQNQLKQLVKIGYQTFKAGSSKKLKDHV